MLRCLRYRDGVEILGQPCFGNGAVLDDVRQGAVHELAHGNQPVEIDPVLETHRLKHEREIFGHNAAA
jgi:hypothetical protein